MKTRRPVTVRKYSVILGFSLLPSLLLGGTAGLNFCDFWSAPQVSDGPADGFSSWTDSWLVPQGNFGSNGSNATLNGSTTLRASWTSSNLWSAGAESDNEQALYRVYLDDGGAGVQVTISGLERWLALTEKTSYQIRCYANNDSANTFQPISIRNGGVGASILHTMTVAALGDGNYPTSGSPGAGQSRGYVDSVNTLTADVVSLTIPPRSGSTRGTLSAFKVTGEGSGPPVDHFESGDGAAQVINAALAAGQTSVFDALGAHPAVTGTFSVAPTHNVQVIQPAGGFNVQTYDLLTLPAGASVNPGDFALVNLPRGVTGILEIDNSGANPILRLNVTEVTPPSPLYWNGDLTGVWDIDATANWSYDGDSANYWEGDKVIFDDLALGTTDVTLDVAVLPASVTIINDLSHPYTILGTGSINGGGTLTKSGEGTVMLGTTNNYAGSTSIQNGTVILAANGALGSSVAGTTIASGGCLDLSGTNIGSESISLSGNGPLGTGALVNNLVGAATATGDITLTGNASIGGTGNITLGSIGGGASLVKSGSGQVTTNTPFGFSGTFTVDEGTWEITAGNTLGSCFETIINDGGTIRTTGDNKPYGGGPSASNKITVNQGGILITTDGSCHLGSIVLNGGSIIATNARNDWANYNLDHAVSTPGSGTTSYITGGNITVSQSGGTVFDIGSGDTLEISAKIDGDTGASDNGLIKQGSGTLVLQGTHTYDSATTVSNGTLQVDGNADRTASVGVDASGTVRGSGSLKAIGATTIDGTVAPGSAADPQGTLGLGSTTLNGSLAIAISGSDCSSLAVTGDITLGAAAAITLSGTPTEPAYVVATFTGTVTGTFTTPAPAGYHWDYDNGAKTISLVAGAAGYAGWISESGVLPADQGMDADPDKDGLGNGIEYILGGNPATVMDGDKLPAGQIAGGNLVITFDRAVSSETPDIALACEYGSDLTIWTSISLDIPNPPMVTITRSLDNLTDQVTVTIPVSGDKLFGRLKATEVP